MRKPLGINSLKKKADRIFSLYIRTLYSKDGLVPCFTCDRVFPIKEIDNGHYVSRTCGALRYDTRNCHPQCKYCNRFKEGNKDEYAIRLIKKYGVNILDDLNRWKRMPATSFNWTELTQLCEELKEKLKAVQNQTLDKTS